MVRTSVLTVMATAVGLVGTMGLMLLNAPSAMAATATCPITISASQWHKEPASWGDSPMKFTPTGPKSFTLMPLGGPGGTYGAAVIPSMDINLSRTPYLSVDAVKLTGGSSSLLVTPSNGAGVWLLRNSTKTGVQTFDLAKALKLTGPQKGIQIALFVNGVPQVLTVGYVQLQSSASGCTASSTAAGSTSSSTPAASASTPTSLPKTGESPWIPVAGVVLASAGVALGVRRGREDQGRSR